MIWLVLLLVALMLKTFLIAGNTQSIPNEKKTPVKPVRNLSSSKDTNGDAASPPPIRPLTAIDPLSHVWLSFVYITVADLYYSIKYRPSADNLT